MIDCLTIQSNVLDMNGDSYRLVQTKSEQKRVKAHFQVDNHMLGFTELIYFYNNIYNNSVISNMCFLAGGTNIEENVYVGPGALLQNKICVGKYAIIGMGAVVLRSVKEGGIVMGNPAKIIGKNDEKTVFSRF